MIVNRWAIEKAVRRNPGLTPTELGEILGIGTRTALRHARKHRSIVVEAGRSGRGYKTRLWSKYNLPSHLEEKLDVVQKNTRQSRPRVYQIDDL